MQTFEQVLGAVLAEERRKVGLTQEELAFRSGLHFTYISMLERGRGSPTVRTLRSLATVLKVTPAELLQRAEALAQESDS